MTPFILQFRELLSANTNALLIWVLIWIVLFFVIREIATWYWKINRIIGLLEEIKDNTAHPALPTFTAIHGKIEKVEPVLVASGSLMQPVSLRFAGIVFGVLLLAAGIVLMILKETVIGIAGLAGALIILLPLAIADRKKKAEVVIEEEPKLT